MSGLEMEPVTEPVTAEAAVPEAPAELAPIDQPLEAAAQAPESGTADDEYAWMTPDLDYLGVPEGARQVVAQQAESMFERMVAAGVDEQTAYVESLNIAVETAARAEREWGGRRVANAEQDTDSTIRDAFSEFATMAGVPRLNQAAAVESANTILGSMSPAEIEGLGGQFKAGLLAQADAVLEQRYGRPLTARERIEHAPLRHTMASSMQRQVDQRMSPPAPVQPRDAQGRFGSPENVLARYFGPNAIRLGG